MNKNIHIPVLLSEVVDIVNTSTQAPKIIFDGTFGGGGYSNIFLSQGDDVYASDLDETTFETFHKIHGNQPKLHWYHGNFSELLDTFQDNYFDAVIADLGFSSNQLEGSKRGFSYQQPHDILDLRYNMKQGIPVYQKISSIQDPKILSRILYTNSGESLSSKIAQSIVEKKGTVETVGDLIEAIDSAIPKRLYHKRNGIYSRVWQALRIWVNDEFNHLEEFLKLSIKKIKPDGVIAVVCFHSLEDRIVTKFMRTISKPQYIDEYGNTRQLFKNLTPKPITPSIQEVEENIRSRSATLRAVQKLK